MTADIGSRPSPHLAHLSASKSDMPTRDTAELNDAQRKDLQWLYALVGRDFDALSTKSASTSSSGSSSPPLTPAIPSPPLLRVELLDGRIYTGRLHCIDSRCNLILANAAQVAGVIEQTEVGGFALGQILIAWKLVKAVQKRKESNAASA